jgi:hypothetical protein
MAEILIHKVWRAQTTCPVSAIWKCILIINKMVYAFFNKIFYVIFLDCLNHCFHILLCNLMCSDSVSSFNYLENSSQIV